MDLQSCDLCNGTEFQQIGDRDRDGKPLATVMCSRCGLVRHAVVPTREELFEFYSDGYREAYNGERTPGARRVMRAWKNGQRICRQVSPLLEAESRLLEVGAGIGCTVKVFEEAGFQAEGIDPGGEFLNYSKNNLGTTVESKSLEDLPCEQQFDTVLLIHVIEHLPSPRASVERIARLIKPGGMFYVECPNLQAPFARRSRLFHTAHIHNFVPSTLQCLVESCGFRLRKMFGDDQDTNLQMLFQHTGEGQLRVDERNAARTLEDLNRANALTYHLRARYVSDRIKKVGSYANEHLNAKRFVAQLIEEYQGRRAA